MISGFWEGPNLSRVRDKKIALVSQLTGILVLNTIGIGTPYCQYKLAGGLFQVARTLTTTYVPFLTILLC